MAKETNTPTPRTPTLEAQPVAKAPPPTPKPEADLGRTGKQLLAHLEETGTPADRCKVAQSWLLEHPEGKAADLYYHLEAFGLPLGTIRKAGKFAFGETFEPEEAVMKVPAEELERCRAELAQVKADLAQANAEKLAMRRARDLHMERCEELARKVSALKAGRNAADLVAAGID